MSVRLVIALLVALYAPPQAQGPAPQGASSGAPKTPVPATRVSEEFVIGLEDVLSIFVWKEPDISVKEVVVRPDGKISVPLLNEIQASGLTTKQLQERLAERLKEFVAVPNVTVTLVKVASQNVSIVGEVAKPGVYPIGAPMTVLELLARAGGFRETANRKNIKIVRREGTRTLQFQFNFKDVTEGKNLEQNIALKSGDVVIVP